MANQKAACLCCGWHGLSAEIVVVMTINEAGKEVWERACPQCKSLAINDPNAKETVYVLTFTLPPDLELLHKEEEELKQYLEETYGVNVVSLKKE